MSDQTHKSSFILKSLLYICNLTDAIASSIHSLRHCCGYTDRVHGAFSGGVFQETIFQAA
jgi:hypothetical protein